MKVFVTLSFVFLFISGVKSQIIVKTSETGLNLRTEPTTSSDVLYSIPNETELLYANDWSEGWIKVRYSNLYDLDIDGSKEDIDAIGWVNLSYIETNMFKSSILQPFKTSELEEGAFSGIWSAYGTLVDFTNTVYNIKINGIKYKLENIEQNTKLNYSKWVNPLIKIEFFGATTDHGIYSSESKGILRVEYNGKVEYIYAALGGGC
jgi:hypothetical protein